MKAGKHASCCGINVTKYAGHELALFSVKELYLFYIFGLGNKPGCFEGLLI